MTGSAAMTAESDHKSVVPLELDELERARVAREFTVVDDRYRNTDGRDAP